MVDRIKKLNKQGVEGAETNEIGDKHEGCVKRGERDTVNRFPTEFLSGCLSKTHSLNNKSTGQ